MVPPTNQAGLGVLPGDLQEAGLFLKVSGSRKPPFGRGPQAATCSPPLLGCIPPLPGDGGPEDQPRTPAPTPSHPQPAGSCGLAHGRLRCWSRSPHVEWGSAAHVSTAQTSTRPALTQHPRASAPGPAGSGVLLLSVLSVTGREEGRPGDAGPEVPPSPGPCAQAVPRLAVTPRDGNQQAVRSSPRSRCPSPDPSASRRPQVRPSIIPPRE